MIAPRNRLVLQSRADKARFVRAMARARATPPSTQQPTPDTQDPTHIAEVLRAVDARFAGLKSDLQRNRRDFQKMTVRFSFTNDAAGYLAWTRLFRVHVRSYDGVDRALDTEPTASSSEYDRLQQSELFQMILVCVPREIEAILTTRLKAEEQTAYHAWKALRQQYIPNEQTYLLNTENRFVNLSWKSGESFTEFEQRFNALTSELAVVGHEPADHTKMLVVRRAIEHCDKKDATGNPVFYRFDPVSKVSAAQGLPFVGWMSAMRDEAHQIDDSLQFARETKRQRVGTTHDTTSTNAVPVSYIPTATDQMPPHQESRPSGKSKEPCHHFARHGHCRFGADCRYSHAAGGVGATHRGDRDRRPGPNRSDRRTGTGGQSKSSELCRNHKAGTCRWGADCHYTHVGPAGGGANSSSPDPTNRVGAITTLQADAYFAPRTGGGAFGSFDHPSSGQGASASH